MPTKQIRAKRAKRKPAVKGVVTARAKTVAPKVNSAASSSQKATKSHVAGGLLANVVGVDGKSRGKVALPTELFAAKVNRPLLAQAVRVYLANQRSGSASTKTRGEVEGSTRKIYRQKGTGRARHGAIRAPIFVGGGIVFGPRPRDYSLSLPKKMKRAALAAALSAQYKDGKVVVVDGLAALEPKTKIMVGALAAFGRAKTTLLVTDVSSERAVRAARNIEGVDIVSAKALSPYVLLGHQRVIMMKEAIAVLKETFVKK